MIQDNSIFSNTIPVGNSLSENDFKALVYEKLELILKNEFPYDREKQRIKVANDRFQFACPFCHDSARDSKKKRGNIIFKEGNFHNCYKCFNCGEFMTIDKFFKEFDVDLPLNAISYISTHKAKGFTQQIQLTSQIRDDLLLSDEMEKYSVDKNYFVKWFGLEYISETTRAGKYLLGRCIDKFDNFLYEPKNDNLVILNLIRGKIIGFQMRPLSKKNGQAKYITVSLRKIHEVLLKDNLVVPDNFESLSMVFNIYNINPEKPVLATEGPIDSMFLPNCVGMLGAKKQVNVGFPLWYVYDSDDAGRKEAIDKLKKGCHVFLWSKLKNEYQLPNQKKWDINDFIKWCVTNHRPIPRFWSGYFSNDSLDIMDI